MEKHTKQLRATKIARLKALGLEKSADGSTLDDSALAAMADVEDSKESATGANASAATGSGSGGASASVSDMKAHVILPTEEDLEKLVLEKKRKGK